MPKLLIFGINFPPKGYIPFRDFLNKIWPGEGSPGPHHHANFHHCGFKNVGLWPPRSSKMVIFGIGLPLRENPGAI